MSEIKLNNGTIISPEEAEKICRLVDRDYHKQDVIAKLRERYGEKVADENENDDKLINSIAQSFEEHLADNEAYFEAMWDSMDYVLKQFFN